MLKMFHYMKERWYYLVMILLLLFVQAFCDLSLPDYTSDIINVGIQQKGIEDGVPERPGKNPLINCFCLWTRRIENRSRKTIL